MAGQAALRPRSIPILHLLFLLLTTCAVSISSGPDESAALLRFRSTLSGSGAALPTWVPNAAPCNVNDTTWEGIICFNGRVWGIQLEDKGLTGGLNLGALVELRGLRTLSFMRNDLQGPVPDIGTLGALKAVYLSNNRFSGEIADGSFRRMRSLKKLFLSHNQLSGPIPTSLAGLGKLLEVRLDHNGFSGRIPDFRQPTLEIVDVAFNKLEGAIPERLGKMDSSFFQGNDGLCGAPLKVACDDHGKAKKGLSGWLIALIILACVLALLILIFFLVAKRRRQEAPSRSPSERTSSGVDEEVDNLERGAAEHHRGSSGSSASSAGSKKATAGGKKSAKESEHGRLAFVQEGRERFELHDLLRASAEVLGSGNFGASYKAVLSAGTTIVVKRFKEMNGVGREDFNEHMRRLGRLSHPNVLPLVAYLYKKEEKLLVTDFVANGSLAHMLHGNRGSTLPPLDWPTRLKIVKGVARGLAYLYDELPVLSLPHGHLKSSNVLLDETFEPLLTDYALAPVMNATTASQVMVAYKSPEVAQFGRPSKKSDVWSLGILVLEILTGRFPADYLHKGKVGSGGGGSGSGNDLAKWVGSIVPEEWSSEVLDGDIKGDESSKQEMHKLMMVGLECCEEEVEKRPEMRDVLKKIDRIKDSVDGGGSS
ncbi:hypothetical protein HPP92_001405 [Vanilla planifolia]|uniref:non-specific serine/threonine protein kinase n=1 Tax=Vanilla planifolia TaxID=51239 RepID=A0A835RRM1_VANPL|nr:hypothetical protein HPP92_001405 [Vanilla planifolia]